MVFLSRLVAMVFLAVPLVTAVTLPLHSSSRWVLDASGTRVKFRCVNWAGHMEANIPEGLDKQPVDRIVDWIARNGFNCVRLTYSTDMALNPTLPVADSFRAAAANGGVAEANMTRLYDAAVRRNPFLARSGVGDVFGLVVDRLWARGVMTILDNHVSRAQWCCDLDDGNGWWDDAFGFNPWSSRFFRTAEWLQGLQAMAQWSKAHEGVVAMSLRNELREFLLQAVNGRKDWYRFMKEGGDLVHSANCNLLILIGGGLGGTDLSHVRTRMLDTSGWPSKNVWEFHAYSFTVTFPKPSAGCGVVKAAYGAAAGFVLQQNQTFTGPLILSEFGFGQTGGPNRGLNDKDSAYLECLREYMERNDADWAVWALQGSYYIRQGTVDYDESFGLLTHDWTGWRNPHFPSLLGTMWKITQRP